MIKIINLSYSRIGIHANGEACNTIEQQAQDIFNENKNYKYVDLVYKYKPNEMYMEHAKALHCA